MANENSPVNTNTAQENSKKKVRSFTVKITNSKTNKVVSEEVIEKVETVEEQRLRIFEEQAKQIQQFNAPFPIEELRHQFVELKRFQTAKDLDKRGIKEMDALYTGFDHLYIVDDLLKQVLPNLNPKHQYGWVLNSGSRNKLNLAEVSNASNKDDLLGSFDSISAYVLAHFGVSAFHKDKTIFIGNVAGYLFMSYFCAYLKISYSVLPLKSDYIKNRPYISPDVVINTQLVQALPLQTKKHIYQLAVFCGKVSLHAIDKAIETMLIADVNDFDKRKEQSILDGLLRYGG